MPATKLNRNRKERNCGRALVQSRRRTVPYLSKRSSTALSLRPPCQIVLTSFPFLVFQPTTVQKEKQWLLIWWRPMHSVESPELLRASASRRLQGARQGDCASRSNCAQASFKLNSH